MSGDVALIGPGTPQAQELLAALSAAGYSCRRFARAPEIFESETSLDAAVLLFSPSFRFKTDEVAALRALAGIAPLIIAAAGIDIETVQYAAVVGAHDVVVRADTQCVTDSIARAIAERRAADIPALPELIRDELLRRIFDLTPNYVSVRDDEGRYVLVSQAFADLHGTTVEEMAGKSIASFAANRAEAEAETREDLEVLQTRRSRYYARECSDSSGAIRQLQIVKRPITLDNGRTFVMCVAVDVTRGRRAESTLEKTNEFLKNILETISDAVFALDLGGKFTLANQRLAQMTGYQHHEILGMPFARIFAAESLMDALRALQGATVDGLSERRFEAHVMHADGHQRVINCSLMPLKQNERIVGVVGTAIDVTERKAAEQRIEHLAYHDPLTNLPNRRLLNDRLTMAMSQAERDGRLVAVLFVDLDRFKGINDSLGHRTGDAVLQELGARLRACVRTGDTVARMGGDEFLFLLPALDHTDEALAVVRKVLDAVRRPFNIEGREFVVTASIGVSFYPNHATDADTLVKHADTALFESKRRASDTYEIFNESMSARSLNYFMLENELRRALAVGELDLVYQPIVEMESKRIVALEALVRWNHPQRGWLLPDDFISLAEETGLIIALGDWVLHAACRQNREWQRRGLFNVPVAVNISARQLDGDLVRAVSKALDASGLEAQYLELELTETILMQSAASSSMMIQSLKELGTRISIDDFGTGYSSLSYLQRFPIDALKIDRSFMPHDLSAQGAGVIAGTIVSMAQSLGIEVVAEGVETREQRDFLLARGCSRAQGHYYWAAMAPRALEALVGGDARHGILAKHAF